MTIEKLKKRDGRLVDFDKDKIVVAIRKSFEATYKLGQDEVIENLANEVVSILESEYRLLPFRCSRWRGM